MGSISMCRREGYGFHAVYSRIGYRNQRVGSRVGYLFPDPTCYTSQNSYRAAVFGKRNSLLSTKDGSYVQYQRWWQHAIHTELLLAGKKNTRSRRTLRSCVRTIHMKPLQNFLVFLARFRRLDRGTEQRDVSRKSSEGWTHSALWMPGTGLLWCCRQVQSPSEVRHYMVATATGFLKFPHFFLGNVNFPDQVGEITISQIGPDNRLNPPPPPHSYPPPIYLCFQQVTCSVSELKGSLIMGWQGSFLSKPNISIFFTFMKNILPIHHHSCQ